MEVIKVTEYDIPISPLVFLEMLSSSLNTLKSGGSNIITVKIKLTDKMSPCITIEIELVSLKNLLHEITLQAEKLMSPVFIVERIVL